MMDLNVLLTKRNVVAIGVAIFAVSGYVILNNKEARVFQGILELDAKEEEGILSPEEKLVSEMLDTAFEELENDEIKYYPFIFKTDKLLKSLEKAKKKNQ